MSAVSEAARELLEATEALGRAIHAGDPELLAPALERRDAAFHRVREVLPEQPGEAERTLLRRVRILDRRLVAAAREAQADVRRELDALATARRAARDFHAHTRELREPRELPGRGPRFIERTA